MVLGDAGKHSEARISAERLVASVEGAAGKEAEELINPLFVLVQATRRLGQLDDSYTVMLRALTICEKYHGEEGMATCQMRSELGAYATSPSSS